MGLLGTRGAASTVRRHWPSSGRPPFQLPKDVRHSWQLPRSMTHTCRLGVESVEADPSWNHQCY
ncbi:hypothetical protein ACFFX0_14250 [Citricoccus parietis]|uniref:Uncharacterized protein n=1 Tax=Citricoccus parietis TaxID=592307 RepID=A0ABV5G1B6_9MICC